MNTISPSDLLARHAPEPSADLDHLMPTSVPPRTAMRRWVALGLAAAVIAGTYMTGQAVLGTPPSAAAIAQLAETAGQQPEPVIPDGAYLRIVHVENPDGIAGAGTGYPRELDMWTGSDGTITVYETRGDSEQTRESWTVRPEEHAARPTYPGLGAVDVARLPADADDLARLARGIGGEPPWVDEGAFEYLRDVLRMGYARPAVNQAAITALGMLSDVRAEPSVSHLGEPCLRVTRTEKNRDREESFGCFDESTGHLLEWGSDYPGSGRFLSIVTLRELLDHGPTEPVDPVRLHN